MDARDLDKILAIIINDENKYAHIKLSLVLFASNDLERFLNCFEINPNFELISDFTKRKSIIEALVEANKLKELVYLVNNILKKNGNQLKLNVIT